MNLYTLADQYQELLRLAATSDDQADAQVFADTLEGIKGEIDQKIESCAAVVKTLNAERDALDEEKNRLVKRAASIDNSAIRMKQYMQSCMEASGLSKVKTPLFTVSIADNPPSVVLEDEQAIPAEFKETKVTVMKSVLKDAIKNGRAIEGAHLEYSKSLRIR